MLTTLLIRLEDPEGQLEATAIVSRNLRTAIILRNDTPDLEDALLTTLESMKVDTILLIIGAETLRPSKGWVKDITRVVWKWGSHNAT